MSGVTTGGQFIPLQIEIQLEKVSTRPSAESPAYIYGAGLPTKARQLRLFPASHFCPLSCPINLEMNLCVGNVDDFVGNVGDRVGNVGDRVGNVGDRVGNVDGFVGNVSDRVGNVDGFVGNLNDCVGKKSGFSALLGAIIGGKHRAENRVKNPSFDPTACPAPVCV